MYYVKYCGNKSLSILGLICPSGAVTNQAGSLSIGPNIATDGKIGGENAVAVNSAVGNKETRELNGDAKVGLEVQTNTAITILVSYRLTIAIGTLVPTSPVLIFVCYQLSPVCSSKPPFSRVQLPSCVPCAKSMALSFKLLKNT